MPGKPRRADKAVKIARDLATKAKVIADTRGETIAEYLSAILRPHIDKDWPKAVKQLDQPPPKPAAGEGGDDA
jgi:hypothetical protein